MANEKDKCRFCGGKKGKGHRCWEDVTRTTNSLSRKNETGTFGSSDKMEDGVSNTVKPISRNPRMGTKPTGEKALFIRLYNHVGGTSLQSGKRLLPPEHEFFHWQFSHVLPKGLYKRFRLYGKNIIPMLKSEHVFVTEHEGEARANPNWNWYFELKENLKQEYNDKRTVHHARRADA